jgi:hypothetical protein
VRVDPPSTSKNDKRALTFRARVEGDSAALTVKPTAGIS